ncbi:MAG: hypothetical protein ACXABU_10745 [Candidatus Hodarchaeales archaeon]
MILLSLFPSLSIIEGGKEEFNVEILMLDTQYHFTGSDCPGIGGWDVMIAKGFNITIANLDDKTHRINLINITESLLDNCRNKRFVGNITLSNTVDFPIILASTEYWQYHVYAYYVLHFFSHVSIKIDDIWIEKPLEYDFPPVTWPNHWTNLVTNNPSKPSQQSSLTTLQSTIKTTTTTTTITKGTSLGVVIILVSLISVSMRRIYRKYSLHEEREKR